MTLETIGRCHQSTGLALLCARSEKSQQTAVEERASWGVLTSQFPEASRNHDLVSFRFSFPMSPPCDQCHCSPRFMLLSYSRSQIIRCLLYKYHFCVP